MLTINLGSCPETDLVENPFYGQRVHVRSCLTSRETAKKNAKDLANFLYHNAWYIYNDALLEELKRLKNK